MVETILISPDFSSRESYGNTWENIISRKCIYFGKILLLLILFVLYNLYVVFAALHSFHDTKSWCEDIKLVIVITITVYIILFLTQIAKLYQMSYLSGLPTFLLNRLKSTKYCKLSQKVVAILFSIALSVTVIIISEGREIKLRPLAGFWLLIVIAFLFSKYPTQIALRPVFWGIGLVFILALILRENNEWFVNTLACMIKKTDVFRNTMHVGSEILFGYLISGQIDSSNETLILKEKPYAFFNAPEMILFNVVFSMMNYLKITAWIFVHLGWLFEISINTTAVESVFILVNFFWGQTVSVLFVQTHLGILTSSELHTILVASFVTIGSKNEFLELLHQLQVSEYHFIFANFLSLPAVITFSKLFYPEVSVTVSKYSDISLYSDSSVSNIISMNLLMAAVKGAIFAVHYICIICGNILGFWAMLSFFNDFIHWPGQLLNSDFFTLQWLVSLPFIPLTYLTGVSFKESESIALCVASGRLWGAKESYTCLSKIRKELSHRSFMIAIYVCGGFSGIVMTGAYLGAMAYICPTKLPDIAQMLLRAFSAGSFAVLSTAYIAGSILF